MKFTQLSDRDRAVLKGCSQASAQGDKPVHDLDSLLNAQKKLRLRDLKSVDVENASTAFDNYEFEDAELVALKKLWEVGHKGLTQEEIVLEASLNCHKHLEAAKDMTDDAAKDDAKSE